VIGPYLIRFDDLPYRDALGEWIRNIPLNIVKTYKFHTGLKTAVWIEMRSDENTGAENNFIHKFRKLMTEKEATEGLKMPLRLTCIN